MFININTNTECERIQQKVLVLLVLQCSFNTSYNINTIVRYLVTYPVKRYAKINLEALIKMKMYNTSSSINSKDNIYKCKNMNLLIINHIKC